jgi:hypothetical protein
MSGVQLSSLLPELGQLTRDGAQSWVNAALAHSSALRKYNGSLYPTDPARQEAAEHLHRAWRDWVEDAKAVIRQTEPIIANGAEISEVIALREEVARAEALLQLPPSLIAQRRQQVERGEVYSLEEVRRELRACSRG